MAISKNSSKLDSEKFQRVLDGYDPSWRMRESSCGLDSLSVPKPDTMITRLKKKTGEARVQEDGLGECCGYLNELMKLLTSTLTST